MSQKLSLRAARLSFVPLDSDPGCVTLTNWLKNGETRPERASNPALLRPAGRYVLKVFTLARDKVMINVCSAGVELLEPYGAPGRLLLPHSASSVRRDVDLKRQPCLVVDVTFGEATFELAERSALFGRLVDQAALNAAQTALRVTLQRDRVATPKLQCKGDPEPFALAWSPVGRVQLREDDDVVQVRLLGLASDLPGDRVRFCLAQDFLEVDLTSHCVVVHLPCKVVGLKGEARMLSSRPEIAFQMLKANNKASKDGFFLISQPVAVVDDDMDHLVRQLDALETGMDTGSTSSGGSDEEKAPGEHAHEDEDFVDCSQNNNPEQEQTERLDNEHGDEKTTKFNNNINKRHLRIVMKTRSISESSDDWSMCQSPCKGILKSSFSMSGDLAASYELSDLSEETSKDIESASSVKKSVSFSDVISKQLFRADSSILGQRKKNQRKARNKRKATQRKRTTSESEDVGSEAECGTPKEGQDMMFDIDM